MVKKNTKLTLKTAKELVCRELGISPTKLESISCASRKEIAAERMGLTL